MHGRDGNTAYVPADGASGTFTIGSRFLLAPVTSMPALVSRHGCTGGASSFSPPSIVPGPTSVVTLNGTALNAANVTVRLELGTTCTPTGGGQALTGATTGGGASMTVALGAADVSGGGAYSVCAQLSFPLAFLKVGSSEMVVRCVSATMSATSRC